MSEVYTTQVLDHLGIVAGIWQQIDLSLLIYTLAEHEIREQLQAQDQFTPDQKGKPTQCPTMRQSFQMFEGIHILLIEHDEMRKRMVLNVQEVHRQIASLLGDTISKFYIVVE